jgi:quinol monooxygenase YgiN
MLIVHVFVHVKPEAVPAIVAATLANARQSVQEPGVARFDVIQQADDPTRFVLVEVYRTAAAPAAHKDTTHYQAWRDAVAEMMAEPRSSVRYANVFPADAGWDLPAAFSQAAHDGV